MATNRELTVRKLPDGEPFHGREQSRLGRELEIAVDPPRKPFSSGQLVEITTQEELLFGVVLYGDAAALTVEIEHSIDRRKLSRIHQNWDGAGA